ncbi:MAG: hypothetical protein WCG25_05140 [bacterium]
MEEEVQEVIPVVVSNPRSSTVQATEIKSNNEDKVKIIEKNIPEEINNTIPEEDEEEEQERTITDEEKIEIEPEKEESDLMKKFLELVNKTKELYNLAQMEETEYVELI